MKKSRAEILLCILMFLSTSINVLAQSEVTKNIQLKIDTTEENRSEEDVVVDLTQIENKEFAFPGESVILKNLLEYPKYLKQISETYKGIPKHDSIHFFTMEYRTRVLLGNLYKAGDLSVQEFRNFYKNHNGERVDDTQIETQPIKIIAVGFENNKQFLIGDINKNKDFSDDHRFEYENNFKDGAADKEVAINRLPGANYHTTIQFADQIHECNQTFLLYPQGHLSFFKLKDIWKGETRVNNTSVEFVYHGYTNEYGTIYVKPKKIPFSTDSRTFNMQFSHRLKDTVSIAGSRFVMDSINQKMTKLYLRNIGTQKNNFGTMMGAQMENIEFTDLENKPFTTAEEFRKKQYTLLEFWGTWCGPCVAITPELKKMHADFGSKLNIISIAVDEDKDRVKAYIQKNGLNWKHSYLPRKESRKHPVIKQLKVDAYPTFFLVDAQGMILYRCTSENIDELFQVLRKL